MLKFIKNIFSKNSTEVIENKNPIEAIEKWSHIGCLNDYNLINKFVNNIDDFIFEFKDDPTILTTSFESNEYNVDKLNINGNIVEYRYYDSPKILDDFKFKNFYPTNGKSIFLNDKLIMIKLSYFDSMRHDRKFIIKAFVPDDSKLVLKNLIKDMKELRLKLREEAKNKYGYEIYDKIRD